MEIPAGVINVTFHAQGFTKPSVRPGTRVRKFHNNGKQELVSNWLLVKHSCVSQASQTRAQETTEGFESVPWAFGRNHFLTRCFLAVPCPRVYLYYFFLRCLIEFTSEDIWDWVYSLLGNIKLWVQFVYQLCVCVCSVMSDALQPHMLQSARLLVHGIFQAGMLKSVAISYSRGSS